MSVVCGLRGTGGNRIKYTPHNLLNTGNLYFYGGSGGLVYYKNHNWIMRKYERSMS